MHDRSAPSGPLFHWLPWGPCIVATVLGCAASPIGASEPSHDPLRRKAAAQLREVMRTGKRWVKVHAAESLVEHGRPEGVREAFLEELRTQGDVAEYRIGIWRVLARVSKTGDARRAWVHKIRDAFLDPSGPDRVHAVESLAKLRYRIAPEEKKHFEEAARCGDSGLAAFALWTLAPGSDAEARLVNMLASRDESTRLRAGYALARLPKLTGASRRHISDAAKKEPAGTVARVYLLGSAFLTAPSADARSPLRAALIELAKHGNPGERRESALALASDASVDDLPLLAALLSDQDADVRAGAAAAILQIVK